MKILLASSEVHPFSKTGGLADMVGALGKALAAAGHETVIVTPLYRGIREKFPQLRREEWQFNLLLGDDWVKGGLWSADLVDGLKIYFVEQPEFFDRAGIYHEKNISYPDNDRRFIFFSKCVAHLARYLPWRPDVAHVHDWQGGLVPVFLQQQESEGWGNPPATCLTIHNLAYQGVFGPESFALTNLPRHYFTPEDVEFFGMVNCLKAGIAFADTITTVSPRYAREIMTEAYGCGLDGLLRKRHERLFGILNGVDYSDWNTTENPHLFKSFSVTRMAGKKINKRELQKSVGLPVLDDAPLFGTITRLAEQKGVDIQLGALAEMLTSNLQFVLLGSGSPDFEKGYQTLARRFPGKVAVRIGYDEKLAHRIEAACDFYLMPSQFEPCGLNQMYSLRYGAVPIVRATGGLDDSVIDYTQDTKHANGIKFHEYSNQALAKAIRKALAIYAQPELFRHYQRNAMKADFSWEQTLGEYMRVYEVAENCRIQRV
ncbi:MAG TPA: glycogen synthase GlgA [Verrucomicrobiae bacterium]|jgi:starch synthase